MDRRTGLGLAVTAAAGRGGEQLRGISYVGRPDGNSGGRPQSRPAYRFIDYMLRPEVMAEVTNTMLFANAKAAPSMSISIFSKCPGSNREEMRERLFADRSLDDGAIRECTRT